MAMRGGLGCEIPLQQIWHFLVISVFPSRSVIFGFTAGLGRKREGNLNSFLINCNAFKKKRKGNFYFKKECVGAGGQLCWEVPLRLKSAGEGEGLFPEWW